VRWPFPSPYSALFARLALRKRHSPQESGFLLPDLPGTSID
jgi:hypothetical protein